MAIHSQHEDIHEVGLVDGCPRCEEHCERPQYTLDSRMLAALKERVDNNWPGRSHNETWAIIVYRRFLRAQS